MSSTDLSPGPVYHPYDPRAAWTEEQPTHAEGRGTFGGRPEDLLDPCSPGPVYRPREDRPNHGPSFTCAPRFSEYLGTNFQCPHKLGHHDAVLAQLSEIDAPHPTVAHFIAAQKRADVDDELRNVADWIKKQSGQINQPPEPIRRCIATLARLETAQLVHMSLKQRNTVRAARRLQLRSTRSKESTPGPGQHQLNHLNQPDSVAASNLYKRGPEYSVRNARPEYKTTRELAFIEAVGSAREGPGPARTLLQSGTHGCAVSMGCDSRMAVDNKMSQVAASLGHYQAR